MSVGRWGACTHAGASVLACLPPSGYVQCACYTCHMCVCDGGGRRQSVPCACRRRRLLRRRREAGIPLEALWSDIDYTDRARMFTTDPQHYPQQRLRELVDRQGQRGGGGGGLGGALAGAPSLAHGSLFIAYPSTAV